MARLMDGQYVTIVMETGRTYVIKPEFREFVFNEGSVDFKEIWEGELPLTVKTSRGVNALIKEASEKDIFSKYFKRETQIIHPKDIGFIMRYLHITREMIIGEAGSGSGHSAIFLSKLAKKVYSYEIDKRHYEVAKQNLSLFDARNVVLLNKNILEENKRKFDMLLFDFKEASKSQYIEKAYRLLKPLSPFVLYFPVMEQVKEATENMASLFMNIKVHEVMHRVWRVSPLRPEFQGLMHTAFMVIGYKNPFYELD